MLGVAIGSQFLLRNGGGSVTIPSFRRDFAGVKTLNHGIGPNITFTRTGTATYFDATGTLTTATADVPRFDHDPSTFESKGLLIEEGRTNSIRNSQAGGSTNGVIGSGGAMPTNWLITPNANGVTSEVVGTGSEGGLVYIDIKISGTPTLSGVIQIRTETDTQVVATSGQTWIHSAYSRLTAGSAANAVFAINVRGNAAGGSAVSGQQVNTTFVPTLSAIGAQRRSATVTFTNATVERVMPFFGIDYTSGSPINFTLRIAAPQLEQGAFATSYIPTTSAAVSRGADVAVVTPISLFYNQSEGTLFAEHSVYSFGGSGAFPRVLDFNNNTDDNDFIRFRYVQSTSNFGIVVANGGVLQVGMGTGTLSLNSVYKSAVGLKADDYIFYNNNSLIATDNSGSMPIGLTHMCIGRQRTSAFSLLNGHIRKIAYYPKRLSNETLRSLTA